ncbi:uncharacterized protein Z520_04548 [Fonsecaea multimorphosa CBS 102226]|uniref:NAD(P)-binding domain-containing protein n=1 Tax=Fonsecaea multimorphosa CBS 102226 TaxID=1442371 RepID=A0A0D2ISI2_9EURO|nr:uncharacterized protein Z520_04548 [Fonsecaea multimorphosa CBS 102226]KIX99911.1 hypothetical protein Z520_04548 [Fonsecaea multimorphosa CBS 102226]OAL26386.1 hypothetical protein AYO22_04304 [Fonsecaea multimorphosa]
MAPVPFSDILLNNTSLLSAGGGPVCVLVGCTGGGIGLATLHALLRHTSSPTIYLVDGKAGLETLVASVQSLNESARLIPVVAEDFSMVSCAQDAAGQIIASAPPRLDILVISPPPTPLEDDYHTRMLTLVTLLPLLRKAASPRVVNVLAGGGGGGREDIPLQAQHDLGMTTSAMTTLFFEHLARQPENDKVVFLHIEYPGVVFDSSNAAAETGERVLFAATNGRFRRVQDPERAKGTLIQQGSDGILGSGVYLVNADSSVVEGGGTTELKRLRDDMDMDDARQKVWEYTMGRVGED